MMADAALESYDAALAAELVPLATLANASLANLYLPSDWGLAYSYTGAASMGGCQYFLAVSPASSPTMCVLVLGALWSDFIAFYTPDNHSLFLVPSSVVGTAAAISADGGFETMYQSIRRSLWVDLAKIQRTIPAFATTLPLVVVGLGPGAPVAQLASLDLRPNKTLSPSPVTSLQSYVYSCPPFADAAFAASFASMVPAAYRVQAPADLFPSQPLPASGYVQAGAQQNLAMAIPTYDSPWVERDGPYYQQLLTGVAPVNDGAGTTAAVPGFDPLLAFAMAKLSAIPYQMAQHPGSTLAFTYSPYVLQQNLSVGATVWASLFEGPDTLVIALRGTFTWIELITLVSNAAPSSPAWLGGNYGKYAQPLVDLYASGRDSLRAALNVLGNKPVILTGHDCGGALANLMAVDILTNPLAGNRTVASVYTFGTGPAADLTFARNYGLSRLGSCNFQVARTLDIMPALQLLGAPQTLGTPVPLSGGDFDSYNGSTYHGLYNYIDLLNPGS
ncbi:lipase family protein [Janthinobacterium sp. RA13]|uniref:lipase family protein n=1 Tax=Janthinobacterium sp. RA13 TaxID=1502762 RepID=UPI0009DE2399|nr:hypothetical protein [Janthinobacterium sp. RA13]